MPRYDYDRRQRSAARKAESDAFVFNPMTIEDHRRDLERVTREGLIQQGMRPRLRTGQPERLLHRSPMRTS
jgi:hypothetical protein